MLSVQPNAPMLSASLCFCFTMLLSVGDFHFFFGGLWGLKPSREHCVLCHFPLQTLTGRPCTAAQHSPRALWLHLKDRTYVQSLCSMELFVKASWDLKLSLLTTPQHKVCIFITDLTRVWTTTAQTLSRRKQMGKKNLPFLPSKSIVSIQIY